MGFEPTTNALKAPMLPLHQQRIWNDRGNPEGELFRQIVLFVELADAQSVPAPYRWSGILESNQGLPPYQSGALTC